MRILATIFAAIFLSSFSFAQKSDPERLEVKILKLERIEEDRGGILWYTIKLVVRDNEGSVYRLHTSCVASNPDSPVNCGLLPVPRVARSYTVNFWPVGMQFADKSSLFDLDSEEASGCK